MDYPKSVPSVGLVNGKFVDENPVTGTPGSLIPAAWGNGVTQEILNVLAAAGIAPDETKTDQLAQALSVLSDWLKLRNKPTTLAGYGVTDALGIGQYGLGSNVAPTVAIDAVGLPGGFYYYGSGNTSFVNYVGLVNIPYGDGTYAGQIGFQQGNTEPDIYVRGCSQAKVWSPTRRLWHSGNLDPASMVVPVGTTIQYCGAVAPTGFLKENGAEISRTVYAKLFAVIGTTYGAGDGSTTFNLPDSRGEFIRGLDDGRGVDPGRKIGSYQGDQIQGHRHNLTWGQGTTGSGVVGNNIANFPSGSTLTQITAPVSDGVNGEPRVGLETRPRNTARLMCIKY